VRVGLVREAGGAGGGAGGAEPAGGEQGPGDAKRVGFGRREKKEGVESAVVFER